MSTHSFVTSLAKRAAKIDPTELTTIFAEPSDWLDPMRATWVANQNMDEAVQAALVLMSTRLRSEYFGKDRSGERGSNERFVSHLIGLGHRVGRRLFGTEQSVVKLPGGQWAAGTVAEKGHRLLQRLGDVDAEELMVAIRPVEPFFGAIASGYVQQGALDDIKRGREAWGSAMRIMWFGVHIAVLEAAVSAKVIRLRAT